MGTPDAGGFFRVIEQHKVVSMFTAPTAIRIIRAEVNLQTLFLVLGSRLSFYDFNTHPPKISILQALGFQDRWGIPQNVSI